MEFWKVEYLGYESAEIGTINLDSRRAAKPSAGIGPTGHFPRPCNLKAGYYSELQTLFHFDRDVSHRQRLVGVEEKRVIEAETLVDMDSVHRRQVQLLQFSYTKQLDLLEAPFLSQVKDA